MAKSKAERAAYMREWSAKNREKVREIGRQSYRRNKAKRNAESSAWYEANKDLALEQSKARYERNKQDPEWRAARAAYLKQYRRANKEKVNAAQREYRDRTEESQRRYSKTRRERHAERLNAANAAWREQNKDYKKRRYADDVQFKLSVILRARLAGVLRRNAKRGPTLELLGCTVDELRVHLEEQWQPGMTWENHRRYGWHIDHIRPLNSFDLTDPDQQALAFHYTNLQPLWWRENISKRDRWEGAPQC